MTNPDFDVIKIKITTAFRYCDDWHSNVFVFFSVFVAGKPAVVEMPDPGAVSQGYTVLTVGGLLSTFPGLIVIFFFHPFSRSVC